VKPDVGLIPIPSLPEHIGVVVRDVDKAVEYLSSTYAIGRVQFIGDYTPSNKDLLAGRDFKVKIATVELGSIKLELLQPLNEESILAQFLKRKGEGLHHIAFSVSNFDEVISKLRAQGVEMLLGGRVAGLRWAYMNTGTKPGGIITEFLEFTVGGD
jgi:methylmalonyl-CoA/ethylmalonyl-CoA epimerase